MTKEHSFQTAIRTKGLAQPLRKCFSNFGKGGYMTHYKRPHTLYKKVQRTQMGITPLAPGWLYLKAHPLGEAMNNEERIIPEESTFMGIR